MKTEIDQFLSEKFDWDKAVALYNKYGKKSGLKMRIARHKSSQLESTLIYELGKLASTAKPAKKLISVVSSSSGSASSSVITKNLTSEPNPSSEKSDTPNESLIALYREQTHLHQQLELIADDEERKNTAFRILEISDEIKQMSKGNKDLKTPFSEIPEDKAKMMKLLTNNRSYISKNKGKEKYADKVAFRVAQNIEIEKRLA